MTKQELGRFSERGSTVKRRVVRLLVLVLLAMLAVGCAAIQPLEGPSVELYTLMPSITPVTPKPSDTPSPPLENTPLPSETAMPTDALEPTRTPALPTDQPAPADTAVPPTDTPVPPVDTAVPPTNTLVPPTATSAVEGPEIVSFEADVIEADPGATVTLSWEVRNATTIVLYHMLPSGQFGNAWEVGPIGTMDYTIPPSVRYAERFHLSVADDDEREVAEGLTVLVTCPDTWFFAGGVDECPASPPIGSSGAEQHFERGTMFWSEADDRIYVLYSDGNYPQWRAYEDAWDEGDPVSDPGISPPSGMFQPLRGFGLIWREVPDVRDRLGWATDQETAYEITVQWTARYKYNMVYVADLDGGVWELGPEGSAWRYIAQQTAAQQTAAQQTAAQQTAAQ